MSEIDDRLRKRKYSPLNISELCFLKSEFEYDDLGVMKIDLDCCIFIVAEINPLRKKENLKRTFLNYSMLFYSNSVDHWLKLAFQVYLMTLLCHSLTGLTVDF